MTGDYTADNFKNLPQGDPEKPKLTTLIYCPSLDFLDIAMTLKFRESGFFWIMLWMTLAASCCKFRCILEIKCNRSKQGRHVRMKGSKPAT